MKKKKKKKKQKKKKEKMTGKSSLLGTVNKWQITFVTLNNNQFCLLSIYPPHPIPPNPAHPHVCLMLMDIMKLDWYRPRLNNKKMLYIFQVLFGKVLLWKVIRSNYQLSSFISCSFRSVFILADIIFTTF